MITEEMLKTIANVFNGDDENSIYEYKTGSDLVRFFNQYFNRKDIYKNPFPSRWRYVVDILQQLLQTKKLDEFFTVILSIRYIQTELHLSEVEAVQKSNDALMHFNELLQYDGYYLVNKDDKFILMERDKDLKYLTSGGYADIYLQKSTGLIIKKLRSEYYSDKSICSRFKREFDITKSLSSMELIIDVYEFDNSRLSYSMERADMTLEHYINKYEVNLEIKIKIIRLILYTISNVHEKGIIHRDLSPTNIFFTNGNIKVADFGLGKDLNVLYSKQTLNTNAVGQLFYCAPEQLLGLKDSSKRSDVFSLGRIINFIMTKSPNKISHIFRTVSEKSTHESSEYRHENAQDLLNHFEKVLKYHNDKNKNSKIKNKIGQGVFDDEIEIYYASLSENEICQIVLSSNFKTRKTLIEFMKKKDSYAEVIIQNINKKYKNICKRFEDCDPFSDFMYEILTDTFSYRVKEIAAITLNEIAYSANRFHAQRLIKDIISIGIEPIIEDILKGDK
ncbi:protein kinase [Staphylococcus pseudintermedius]|uniref:protein kinase domain-containing protein n=1 Tax=Staphylococcus TaxID=1279 RepID=UPI0010D957C1|nr:MULTISPECIES: protein kinase [Staphylococcus]MDT0855465.1 protein kinase [Staphylococcus pseudintermedius]MDU0482134.1 protein kinase [Staphylococcus aureus]VTS43705.1 tyrosine kinase family protein [Staphylococcus pseudintermedius]HAR6206971.1 protein kinase [Staphylococcus pseudintermedius]